MKYFFLILLLLLGTCAAEENLTWMIGHEVTFIDLDFWGAGIDGAFSVDHGAVTNASQNFVMIDGKWIQSNWIWSIDEV